jgi:hypothetical protein
MIPMSDDQIDRANEAALESLDRREQPDDYYDHPGDELPIHRPFAPDAPIPGVHHYGGCDPDHPRVGRDGRCQGCGEEACSRCGYGDPCHCTTKED